MCQTTERNKSIVKRFNKEVIEQGNKNSFNELIAENVINHSAPPGTPIGPDSMGYFLFQVLRTGFSDLKVEILDQIAEGDRVTTRKKIHAMHTGNFMGISPSNKKVEINVIDIIRLKDEKYIEHWGLSTIPEIVAQISGN